MHSPISISKTTHRRLLERHLKHHIKYISGNVIDVGSGGRRYDSWINAEITAVDKKPNKKKGIQEGDLEKGIPLKSGSFDSFLCIEVLQYLDQFEKGIKELARLVREGSYGIVVVPHFYPDHGENLTFSAPYIADKFKEYFTEVKSIKFGNFNTMLYDTVRLKFRRIPFAFLRMAIYSLMIPWALLLNLLRLDRKPDDFYSGIFLLVRK